MNSLLKYGLLLLAILLIPVSYAISEAETSAAQQLKAGISNSSDNVVYTAEFGLMEKVKARWKVKEADVLPREPGLKFGYYIYGKENVHFRHRWIIYLPGALEERNEQLEKISKVHDEGKVLKGKSWGKGNYMQVWAFSDSDPLGSWRLELYVEDELLESYTFKVVAPMM